MKTTFISVMALGVAVAMAGPADRAQAGEPMVLTGDQLDQVTAGINPMKIDGFLKVPDIPGKTPTGVELSFSVAERAGQNPNFFRGFVLGADDKYVKTVPEGRSNREP